MDRVIAFVQMLMALRLKLDPNGIYDVVGKPELRELAESRADVFWQHLRKKHPDWFTPAGGFRIHRATIRKTPAVPMLAVWYAIWCAARNKKCPHKAAK